MSTSPTHAYWEPICQLVNGLRGWSRLAANDGAAPWITDWGSLLLMPTDGYLEVSEGPLPVRNVQWVEVSTAKVLRKAGLPLTFPSIEEELLAGLANTQALWTISDTRWSQPRLFEDRPVRVVQIANPFQAIS